LRPHDPPRQEGEVSARARSGWMAAEAFELDDAAPLPLAIQPAPCGMRSMVTSALQAQNRSWSEAFVGSGILAIGAAVSAGIGIGAMVERMAPAGCRDVRERFALPELPPRDVVLYSAHRDTQTRALINTLSEAIAN
ncbi:LysR family transcriptional regulator, partial [Salmonella enterica subsp. enterica serovar Wilhelmsburg]